MRTLNPRLEYELSPVRGVMFLTALAGGSVVFLFGCAVGAFIEPSPGAPLGIPILSWVVPALLVVTALPSLIISQRARRHQRRPPQQAVRVSDEQPRSGDGPGSGLELFQPETSPRAVATA